MADFEITIKVPVGGVGRTYPAWLEWPRVLVPYRFRRVHRWWARWAGFFWLLCPLCGVESGGHEWRDIDGKPSHVPDPTGSGHGSYVGICPVCTRAGRGVD